MSWSEIHQYLKENNLVLLLPNINGYPVHREDGKKQGLITHECIAYVLRHEDLDVLKKTLKPMVNINQSLIDRLRSSFQKVSQDE